MLKHECCYQCDKRYLGCKKDCQEWKDECEAIEAEKQKIYESNKKDFAFNSYKATRYPGPQNTKKKY